MNNSISNNSSSVNQESSLKRRLNYAKNMVIENNKIASNRLHIASPKVPTKNKIKF